MNTLTILEEKYIKDILLSIFFYSLLPKDRQLGIERSLRKDVSSLIHLGKMEGRDWTILNWVRAILNWTGADPKSAMRAFALEFLGEYKDGVKWERLMELSISEWLRNVEEDLGKESSS